MKILSETFHMDATKRATAAVAIKNLYRLDTHAVKKLMGKFLWVYVICGSLVLPVEIVLDTNWNTVISYIKKY